MAESWVLRVHLRFAPSSTAAIFSFLVLFSLAAGALSSDPRPEDCEPRHCGNGLNISYPFWIRGVQQPYCGFPGYDVTCKGDAPVADHGSAETYRVRDIFYDNMSVIINAEQPVSSCPYPRHNLSFLRTLFEVSSVNRELFFYLNCTARLPRAGLRAIECAENGEGKVSSWVAEDPNVPADQSVSPASCDSVVVSPFLAHGAVDSTNRSYESLLDDGFLLEWKAPNCSRCRASGGRCGYNQASNEFMCICSDRVHRVSCGDRGSKKIRKVAIGVGAGAGGFLLASFLCLLLYRRKKMRARAGSSTLLFRTASLEPSSRKDPETGSTHYPTHLFKYDELSEATDGFSDANELGDGGFGTVYKGKLRDGRIVAVKRLYENNYKRVEQFLNEVAILNRLQHPNLVSLYGCTSRHSRELLLVYEYVPNGTVADHLHGHRAAEGPALEWPVRLSIGIETATALAYLHRVEPQIIHRDVKTNNILLDSNFHVKVADFGLSRLFPVDATHVSTAPQGTPGYVDPEYHQCYQLTDKSDVYSFGVVLVELISSKPAVDITRHRHEINLANMAMNKIRNGALHELVDPALEFETDWVARRMIQLVAELAFRCLQAEKEMRPSMEDVLEVLQGIRDCQDEAERSARMDHGVTDGMSLLKRDAPPVSPDSVMDKWSSRTTTPNTSA